MMNIEDFDKIKDLLSDQELDAYLQTGKLPQQFAQVAQPTPRPAGTNPATGKPFTTGEVVRGMFGANEDTELGMSQLDLARAGMGADIERLIQGIKHGAQHFFAPSDPVAKKKLLDQINAERAEREAITAQLMKNPAAVAGSVAGKVGTAMAAPARLPAQVALEMGLGAMEDVPGPAGDNELASRLMQGGERGLTTAVVGKGVQAIGKGIGAAQGKFTEKGAKAMALRDAAEQQLGINMSLGELDPQSWMGMFARKAPSYVPHLEEQGAKLAESMSKTKQVPSLTGRSTTSRTMPGEDLRESIVNAAKQIEDAGSSKWQAVDDYILQNNVPQITPSSFLPVVENIGQRHTSVKMVKGKPQYQGNEVFDRVSDYNDQAGNWLRMMAGTPVAQQGSIPFSAVDDIRKAVGKALQRAEKDMAAPNPTQTTREARNELRKLYASLNDDMEQWAKKNAKTGEAKALFDEANTFWRERVVPDVIQNRLARKSAVGEIGTKPQRGYENAEQMYTDIIGKGGAERVARLEETLNPRARTQIDVMRKLEETSPLQTDAGLAALALIRTAQGYPVSYGVGSALPRIPSIQRAARSRPVQALHFAEDVFRGAPAGQIGLDTIPRLAWGAVQYPQEGGLGWVRKMRGSRESQ